jgi:hypothetical protein
MSTYNIVKAAFSSHQIFRDRESSPYASAPDRTTAERVVKALTILDQLEIPVAAPKPSELALRLETTTVAVGSDWIERVGYDAKDAYIVLYKKDGGVIAHQGIDQGTAMKLLAAESVGSEYNKSIKGKFPMVSNFKRLLVD